MEDNVEVRFTSMEVKNQQIHVCFVNSMEVSWELPLLVEVEASINFYQLKLPQPRSVEPTGRFHKSPPTSITATS